MVYIPPSYEILQQSTRELQHTFNRVANRYQPPAYEALIDRIQKMQREYCRQVRDKGNLFFATRPDSVRLGEIACIMRLIDSVPPTMPGSAESHHVHNILLGALLYRRQAIEDSYHGSVSTYLNISNERYSALYLTIEGILELNPSQGKILDALSVATCCRAYHGHLKSIDPKKQSLYILADEADFFSRLEAMIEGAEVQSKGVVKQLSSLETIQVIGELLNQTFQEVQSGLELFTPLVSSALVKKDSLSRKEIIQILQASHLSPRSKAIFEYLIVDDKTLNRSEEQLLIEEMKRNLVVYNQFCLLGAYVFVMNKTPMEQVALKKTLYLAINAVTLQNALDDEARTQAILALDQYLSFPGIEEFCKGRPLDYKAMKDEVRLKASELQNLQDLASSAVTYS